MSIRYTVVLICISHISYAQLTYKDLFNKVKNATPPDTSSVTWKTTMAGTVKKKLCITGDCKDGYGIMIYNTGGYTPLQVESTFAKGIPTNPSVYTYIGGGNINKELTYGKFVVKYINGAYKFYNHDGTGFTLELIQYFHSLSSEKLYPCNCLVPIRNRVHYETAYDKREIKDDWDMVVETNYDERTVEKYTDGLINTSKQPVILRGFRRKFDIDNGYFDLTRVVMPGESVGRMDYTPLNFTVPEKSSPYYAQYTTDSTLVKLCEERWQAINPAPVPMGNGVYKITAYTDEPIRIKVRPGNKISISASGTLMNQPGQIPIGPEGTKDEQYNARLMIKNTPDQENPVLFGTLLARVGDCDWVSIGKGYSWTTECYADEITLKINDKNPMKTNGHILVKLVVGNVR